MAYVYKITFNPTNQYYIGYRGSKKATPSDLLETYFTSSKVVARLIKEHGVDNFIKEILAEFDTGIEAYEYEQQLLREHDVESNTQMLNKRLTSCALDTFKYHTDKTRVQMSESRRQLWANTEYKEKVSAAVKNSWQDPARAASFKTPKFRQLKSQQSKELWQDPTYLEKYTRSHSEAMAEPEYREWHSNHKKELWKDPAYREKRSQSSKAKWADPEYKTMMKAKRKAKWADPEYKVMMLAARKK